MGQPTPQIDEGRRLTCKGPVGVSERRRRKGSGTGDGTCWRGTECLLLHRSPQGHTTKCGSIPRGGYAALKDRGDPLEVGAKASTENGSGDRDGSKGPRGGVSWLEESESSPLAKRSQPECRNAHRLRKVELPELVYTGTGERQTSLVAKAAMPTMP